MKYVRTKDGIYETREGGETYNGFGCKTKNGTLKVHKNDIVKQSDTIEELIMVGDLVVWYNSSSQREEYLYIHNEDELFAAIHYTVKQLFIKVGENFNLVAKENEKGELTVCQQ